MKSYPIPNFPRYTLGEDHYTVRCIQPYKKHVAPHIVRPWALACSPTTAFVTLRDAADKVVNISMARLEHIVFGDEVYGLPSLPDDLVPLQGFPAYAYSASEDIVCQVGDIRRKPFAPHRKKKYALEDGDYTCSLRDYAGVRVTKRMSWVKKLAKGLVSYETLETFDHNLPDFMRQRREKGPDSYKRRKYRSRRLSEPVDPSSALFTQGAGPEPVAVKPDVKTKTISVSSVATIIVPEKSTERRIF